VASRERRAKSPGEETRRQAELPTLPADGRRGPRSWLAGEIFPSSLGALVIVGAVFAGAAYFVHRAMVAPDVRLQSGRAQYELYCSGCHGEDGRGHGPLAAGLATAPADLTQIAARSGGTFDAPEIATFIDGRKAVAAHGPRLMPIWGELLASAGADPERDAAKRARIDEIVAYLWSIQR